MNPLLSLPWLKKGAETRKILAHYRTKNSPLSWKPIAPSSAPRHDAPAVQVGGRLYIFGGYASAGRVNQNIGVLDLSKPKWLRSIPLPPSMAHHHQGIATDGTRFIYCVSGQVGAWCSPAIREAFVYDLQENRWASLPSLPEARYAPAMKLWRGRLHLAGGAGPDRYAPKTEHWSLGVNGSQPLEKEWRPEVPLPRGGCHRASALIEDSFYIFGGQEGHFIPIPGDPDYKCFGKTVETVYPDVYRLSPGASVWERMADMPAAVSHAESSLIAQLPWVLLLGGFHSKDPQTFRMELTDVIQGYNTETNQWQILGRLPYRAKTMASGYDNGLLTVVAGQRDKGPHHPAPGQIESRAWRAKYSFPETNRLPFLAGKKILLVTHLLELSGAPLFLLELGAVMNRSGAQVSIVNLKSKPQDISPGEGLAACSLENSFDAAAKADLIIANTAVASDWVRQFLEKAPGGGKKLIWWIHEIDTEMYAKGISRLDQTAALLFDSQASLEAWRKTGLAMPALTRVIHPNVADEFSRKASAARYSYKPHSLRNLFSLNKSLLFSRNEIRKDLEVGETDFLLTLIANSVLQKGQKLLIETVGEMLEGNPALPLKLLMISPFKRRSNRDFLKSLKPAERKALGNRRLMFTRQDLCPYYAASDAFVMNSQGLGENFGRTTIEAMTFGVPVLGTDAGGTPEIVIHGETGLLHPLGQEGKGQLKQNIARLMANRAEAKSMGEKGRERVLNYFGARRFYLELSEILRQMNISVSSG